MSPIPFETDAIRMLAGLMDETGLTEIELTKNGRRFRLVRGASAAVHHSTAGAPPAAAAATPALAAADHEAAITSPMIGVVYLTPEPNAPPFVTVGAQVAAGQTLLLIEAMKTFNPIVAAAPGTVTKILVQGGDSVEVGQPLIVVE